MTPSVENERSPFSQSASAPHDAPRVADGTSSTAAPFHDAEASARTASSDELETPTNCGEGAARAGGGTAALGPPSEAPFSAAGAGAAAALLQTVSAPPLGVLVQLSEAISSAGTSTEVPGPPPPLPPAFLQTTPEGVQRRTPSVCFFFGGGESFFFSR